MGWLALGLALAPLAALAQRLPRGELERLADAEARRAVPMLRELLAIPNDAHFPDQLARNREWIESAFAERGFALRALETAGEPLLLAERRVAQPERRVLVYLQVDGQPVDPSRWPLAAPFEPTLSERTDDPESSLGWRAIPWSRLEGPWDPEWRIFARSSSDAKGPIAMLLAALDALERAGRRPSYDLALIFDFEEELGSPHLPAAVERHREALAADLLIIFDGPRHPSNRPTLSFGARGIATVTLEVYGPRVPQHSGHYGNWVPNPAQRLAALLASLKGDDGRVLIPGFYDGVELDEATRAILRRVPDDEESILRSLGLAAPEAVGATLQEAIQYPSLNVRGLSSAWVGVAARTVVPASAVAELDLRLVPETPGERQVELVRAWVEGQGYHLVSGPEPTDEERATHPKIARLDAEISYEAFRTPYDSQVGRWLTRALRRAFGEAPIRIPMAGGSIPISPFVVTLGVPAVSVPTVNADNNQHSPNENLRLGNWVEGVRTFLAILDEPIVEP
ncbi:MAG TPA: M20/M25/M40 family metallo-hydrolase [Thermoanaerobaculia bacterium]|nr:M20/M25/M40 family metallo-hydrolase [Thermoanaerobaculia bacterium]